MIGAPLNDRACLGQITEIAKRATLQPELRQYAAQFRTAKQLAASIRQLPQTNDTGDPADGPRVACDTPQRVRVLAPDPNCVERSLMYLAVAELVDPRPLRQLITIDTPMGRHTYPVEHGWHPVVLDPLIARNVLAGGLFQLRQAAAAPGALPSVEPRALVTWLAWIAREQAWQRDGKAGTDTVDRARHALEAVLSGDGFNRVFRADVLYALDRASEAATCYGETGVYGVKVARIALAELGITADKRNACSPCGPLDDARASAPGPASAAPTRPVPTWQLEVDLGPVPPAGFHTLSSFTSDSVNTPRNFSWRSLGRSVVGLARKGGRLAASSYGLGGVYDATVAKAERAAARIAGVRPVAPQAPELARRVVTLFDLKDPDPETKG